jgi:hypothetical protein
MRIRQAEICPKIGSSGQELADLLSDLG